jgi:hypothetical protein
MERAGPDARRANNALKLYRAFALRDWAASAHAVPFDVFQLVSENIDRLSPDDSPVTDEEGGNAGYEELLTLSQGFIETVGVTAVIEDFSQYLRVQADFYPKFNENFRIADIAPFFEVASKHPVMERVMTAAIPCILACFQSFARIGEDGSVVEPDPIGTACRGQTIKHALEVHARKSFGQRYAFLGGFGVELEAHPLVFYGKFFFQFIDKALADVTERSNVIGKDPYNHFSFLRGTNFGDSHHTVVVNAHY